MTPFERARSLFGSISLAAFSLAAALLPFSSSPATAKEGCTWSLNGAFPLQQSNSLRVTVTLLQSNKGALTGTGEIDSPLLGKSAGSLEGSVAGDNVKFTIYWGSGHAVGDYTGTVNDNGRMERSTRDRFNPQSTASWYSTKLAPCLLPGLPPAKTEPPTPKQPKPGKRIESPGKFFDR